ncbi:MAG: EamA family transporter [Aestuariivita sp.]|nr:EamA family transporter [Aestuariivita sp.]MCY4345197.1 EamA family transporter [Aestuariivita sp.]
MQISSTIILAAMAPVVWGSSYLVTTELLPDGYPVSAAALRALPAGLILLILVRNLPQGIWIMRTVVLGALNFSIFWWLLFVSAYELPGGVAATVSSTQPLMVFYLARWLLGQSSPLTAIFSSIAGLVGVGLLVLTPEAELSTIGLIAALGAAVSMALGTVLTRKWQPSVSALTFTAWQLTAGGLLLLPAALLFEPPLPSLTANNVIGFVYLGLFGSALGYFFWFRCIAKYGPSVAAPLTLLSPATAVLLGWVILGQTLSVLQSVGIVMVLSSIWISQRAIIKVQAKK